MARVQARLTMTAKKVSDVVAVVVADADVANAQVKAMKPPKILRARLRAAMKPRQMLQKMPTRSKVKPKSRLRHVVAVVVAVAAMTT
jgi:ATP phosphoribosyltransferase regulatory subunit HisZ